MISEALEWARPLGWGALILPAVLLILRALPRRPRPLATGTLKRWRHLAGEARGGQKGRRWPLSRWLLWSALVLGALALASPREPFDERPVMFDVVVDRSPSMYLPAGAGGGLRLEFALQSALAALPANSGDVAARLRFLSISSGGRLEVHEGACPAAWRHAPEQPAPALEVARWDTPGTLLVTDVLDLEPVQAAWFACGATPQPGLIGESAQLRWIWDGAQIVSKARPPRRVALAPNVPEPLRALFEIWASERGFELVKDSLPGAEEPPALRVVGPDGPAENRRPLEAQARGWDLAGEGLAWTEAEAPGRPWLWGVQGRGEPARVAVAWSPGEVHVAWSSLREPGGDPAAFALAWAELLDGSLRASEGVIAFEERAQEGPASKAPSERWVGRELPEGADQGPGGGWSLEAIAAAVCALLAVGSSLLTSGDDGGAAAVAR